MDEAVKQRVDSLWNELGGRDDAGTKPIIANGVHAFAYLFDVVADSRCTGGRGEGKKQGMAKYCGNGGAIFVFHCRPPVVVNDFTPIPSLAHFASNASGRLCRDDRRSERMINEHRSDISLMHQICDKWMHALSALIISLFRSNASAWIEFYVTPQ
jgi:hypothetical protein